MDIILTVVTPLLIGLCAFVVFALARRENRRKNENLNRRSFVIRSTYTWGVIMVTADVLLLLLIVFGNIEEPFPILLNVILSLLILGFAYGALQVFRERVSVEGNRIVYTPAIGSKKEYSFDKLERIENKKTGIHVFVNGKKVFTLDPSGIGTQLFIDVYKTREF